MEPDTVQPLAAAPAGAACRRLRPAAGQPGGQPLLRPQRLGGGRGDAAAQWPPRRSAGAAAGWRLRHHRGEILRPGLPGGQQVAGLPGLLRPALLRRGPRLPAGAAAGGRRAAGGRGPGEAVRLREAPAHPLAPAGGGPCCTASPPWRRCGWRRWPTRPGMPRGGRRCGRSRSGKAPATGRRLNRNFSRAGEAGRDARCPIPSPRVAQFEAGPVPAERPSSERGVAVPFTTPHLLGGRIRPGLRGGARAGAGQSGGGGRGLCHALVGAAGHLHADPA